VLYALAMVAVVVGVDVLFVRHQFWERLISNAGIVLVFAAFYLRFLKRPIEPQPPQCGVLHRFGPADYRGGPAGSSLKRSSNQSCPTRRTAYRHRLGPGD